MTLHGQKWLSGDPNLPIARKLPTTTPLPVSAEKPAPGCLHRGFEGQIKRIREKTNQHDFLTL
jgi:hypothetical protein